MNADTHFRVSFQTGEDTSLCMCRQVCKTVFSQLLTSASRDLRVASKVDPACKTKKFKEHCIFWKPEGRADPLAPKYIENSMLTLFF